ncbi:ATP-dependent RNA helicase DHX36 [Orussus abietinus]|uniref:ATP-dependent RNA helicase DHX36 n=1 Tax=Orussus abietinus TaxID=222816 RepID=UPI000624F976|nr:ATP-dependent RNA helicase DHX36 [Orussus abietinus]
MSRSHGANSYDSRGGRRSGINRGHKTGRGPPSGVSVHSDQSHSHRGHPPHLKGKDIGLYYRDKARQRNAKNTCKVIKLKENVEQEIRALLENTRNPFIKQYGDVNDAGSSSDDVEKKYAQMESQLKKEFLQILSGSMQNNLAMSVLRESKLKRNDTMNKKLLDELKARETSSEYTHMLQFRKKLPAYKKKEEIIKLINDNQVIVISGETGCGKTTQVAQFMLDDQIEQFKGSETKIICTQPRRISAISVAERVAAERAERLGHSVGFQIRLEKVSARDRGSILYCTTGMLLQFMQIDPALMDYSHIILDEIHERSTECDFILALLKHVIPKRPNLKVILMSATLNSERFSQYYNNCPNIHIPGFTYPVEELYLEDVLAITRFQFPEQPSQPVNYRKHSQKFKKEQRKRDDFLDFVAPYVRHLRSEKKYPEYVLSQLKNPNSENLSLDLIDQLVRYICMTQGPGAILIFLPGLMDISKLHRMMLESGQYPQNRYIIYCLHSRMPTVDQKLIFNTPPNEVRKIIIATSIAETSITIEDVVYVIDCGKTKLSRFDVENNMQTLEAEWLSLANAKQRRGRAGRVKPGICYHLYTKAREMTFDQYPLPEMLRTRLEEVILQEKILQLGDVASFLSSVMDPPDSKAIELSLELLRTLNALDERERLTPLGYHLAQLPLDPRTGKMIILGALFSCVEPIFAIAASLSFKDAFYCPLGKEDEARKKKLELGRDQLSDHVALAEALRRFELAYNRGYASSFCREYFLSFNTLKLLCDMKSQFARHLCEKKFLYSDDPRDDRANRNSSNLALVKAIVCAGLFPNVAVIKSVGKFGVKATTPEDGTVAIHPSSINEKDLPKVCIGHYMTYFLKKRSTAIYLHDTTIVSRMALILAGPNSSITNKSGKCLVTLTNSLAFPCDPGTAQIIQKLREKLDQLLEYKITHPGSVRLDGQEGNILKAFVILMIHGDEDMELGIPKNDIASFGSGSQESLEDYDF